MGKHKPIYTPSVDTGDFVIVINAEKIKLTGRKTEAKEYQSYSFYPGGHKYVSFNDMMARNPKKIIELAVKRMMPKTALGERMLKKLKIYRGQTHKHVAQMPEKIEL